MTSLKPRVSVRLRTPPSRVLRHCALTWAPPTTRAPQDGALQFHEFVAACRRIDFCGNLRRTFEDLTHGAETLKPEAGGRAAESVEHVAQAYRLLLARFCFPLRCPFSVPERGPRQILKDRQGWPENGQVRLFSANFGRMAIVL